jgi:SAM-dependent methyltransferase
LIHSPFDHAGFASLDDISTPVWQSIFSHLESVQTEFLATDPHTPDYPWPRDPLHNFIRVWEYPFVYHHLQSLICDVSSGRLPQVVDLGSGATFFPFAVAQLGCNVLAVDTDSRAISSVDRAIGMLSPIRGAVTSLLSDARSLALESDSSDALYCVSVLEHIPNFEDVISEIHRILRPGGLFVLTFDIGLSSKWELGPAAFRRLQNALLASFTPVYPEEVIHPLRVLTSENSIYPLYPRRSTLNLGTLFHFLLAAFERLRTPGSLMDQLPPGRLLATTYGTCLRKGGSPPAA